MSDKPVMSVSTQANQVQILDDFGQVVADMADWGAATNARRFVAAWNVCRGIPVEALEGEFAGGLPWRVADQIDARLVQAELVAALRMAIGAMRAPIDGWKGDVEATALQVANAAIARATGGKT